MLQRRRNRARSRGELTFLAPGDVSKGRVEPISWMRTCEAYANEGLDVTLVALRMRRPDAVDDDDVWLHFGIDECFNLVMLPTPLDHDASITKFRLSAGVAATVVAATSTARTFRHRGSGPIVHARAPVLLAPFVLLRHALPRAKRPLLVFETHVLPRRSLARIVQAADLVVVNSEKLAEEVHVVFELEHRRVLHAPLPPYNPVQPQPKSLARRRLRLADPGAVACYTGKMTRDNNEFMLQAARIAAGRIDRFRLLLVGGNPDVIEWTRKRVRALGLDDVVVLTGFVPPAEVEQYQSAADILINRIPETMGTIPYATPAKLYEYQAMERPIVAADFPLFEEVFGKEGERAIRVMDPTPQGFALGIISAFTLEDKGRAMTQRAAAFVRGRTWASRSAAILDALGV